MALDLAVCVFAVLILGPVAIFPAGVRQNHRIVVRLLESPTIAVISGHFVFSVAELTVGTRPIEEGNKALRPFFKFLLFRFFVALVYNDTPLLLLFVFLNVLLQTLVKFLNPTLDASKMERLATLLAVPESTALVNWIVADHALLRSLGQRLDQKDALLRKVFKLVQEVSEVVLYFGLVLQIAIASLAHKLHFFLALDLLRIIVIDILRSCTQVIVCPLASARIVFPAS